MTVLPGFLAGQAAMAGGPGGGPGGGAATVGLLVFMIPQFVGVFVGFLVYLGLFHAVSTVFFGSEGPIGETAAVAGWGYVPALFGVGVTLLVNASVWQTVALPADPAQMGATIAAVMDRPIFLAAWLLGIVFLAWQAFLWVVGLERVKSLTTREAALTIAAPVVLDLLGRIYLQFFFGPGA